MRIVDTHLHLWEQDRFPYSWTKGIESLNRDFGLSEYQSQVEGWSVSKSIFMECDVDPEHGLAEAKWAQSICDGSEQVVGIVATAKPEDFSFRERLDRLKALPAVRGIRRVLHTQDDALSQSDYFRSNLRNLPEFDFTFDLCVLARQLPIALELVRSCPEVQFVLDHCGVPDVKAGTLEPWKSAITAMAQEDNVLACKVSGLVAYADPDNCTLETLKPWFEAVVNAFGWDRLVWGGDWPVCTLGKSLTDWIQLTHQLCAGVPEEEKAKLFHLNAERIYRV